MDLGPEQVLGRIERLYIAILFDDMALSTCYGITPTWLNLGKSKFI